MIPVSITPLSYPGARILSFDGGALEPIAYEDTEHYRVTKDFLADPAEALECLFSDEPDG